MIYNLKDILNKWKDGEKVKGLKTPPLETVRELQDINYGIQKETINSTVVEVLDKCNIKTKTKGIGWEIC